jgi:hypothetical protein
MTEFARWEIWLQAACTLGIFSFLYRENKAYRLFEHILLGLGVGVSFAATWTGILKPKWWDRLPLVVHRKPTEPWYMLEAWWFDWGGSFDKLIHGGWVWILAGLVGLMWYTMYSKKYAWLSRIVIGLTLGAGAGLAFKAQFNAQIPQLLDSFKSPYIPAAEIHNPVIDNWWSNIIFVVTIVTVLLYFFFSIEHRHPVVRNGSKWGRWMIMVSFGPFFANAVMTRTSVFIDRILFLVRDWAFPIFHLTPK